MAEGVVRLPPNSTGSSLRTVTNAGVASGAHQEVVTLASSTGVLLDPATEATLAALLAELGQKLEAASVLVDHAAPQGTADADGATTTTNARSASTTATDHR